MTLVTGRMWGYTDELDWVERQIRSVLHESMTFTVTDRKLIGQRGWFNKRFVSKYEYEMTGTRKQCEVIVNFIQSLVAQIS